MNYRKVTALFFSMGEEVRKWPQIHAYLEVWDVELVVGGEVVGTRGGCHHFVPCLLAGLLSRCRDQPKLSHGYSTGAAGEN